MARFERSLLVEKSQQRALPHPHRRHRDASGSGGSKTDDPGAEPPPLGACPGEEGVGFLGAPSLRLSRMACDLPQLAEADLNPVVARPDGVVVLDVRVRLLPRHAHDPYLRRLR